LIPFTLQLLLAPGQLSSRLFSKQLCAPPKRYRSFTILLYVETQSDFINKAIYKQEFDYSCFSIFLLHVQILIYDFS